MRHRSRHVAIHAAHFLCRQFDRLKWCNRVLCRKRDAGQRTQMRLALAANYNSQIRKVHMTWNPYHYKSRCHPERNHHAFASAVMPKPLAWLLERQSQFSARSYKSKRTTTQRYNLASSHAVSYIFLLATRAECGTCFWISACLARTRAPALNCLLSRHGARPCIVFPVRCLSSKRAAVSFTPCDSH